MRELGEIGRRAYFVHKELSTGDFYCLSPSSIHKIERLSEDLNIYNISVFLPDISEGIRKVVESMPLPCRGRLSREALSRVCMLYDVLFSDIQKRSAGEKEKVSALALYILSELSDSITDRYVSPRKHHTNLHVQRDMRYVQDNFTSELRLYDVAVAVGVTECYLSCIFSSLIGSTFGDYLSLVRIKHAKNLLSTTDMPVTEIAFACGFGSFSNFERVFKKICGITPKAYRKSHI